MANIFGYDEVAQGTDWQKIPKQAYLAIGTERMYNGRRIRLVEDSEGPSCAHCAIHRAPHLPCFLIKCTHSSRPDGKDVHWEYVEEADATGKDEPQELTPEVAKSTPAIGSVYMWNGRVVRLEEDTRPGGCSEGCACKCTGDSGCALQCGMYCNGDYRADHKTVYWKYVDSEDKPDEDDSGEEWDESLSGDLPIGTVRQWRGRNIRLVLDKDDTCDNCVLQYCNCNCSGSICGASFRADNKSVCWKYVDEIKSPAAVGTIQVHDGKILVCTNDADDSVGCDCCYYQDKDNPDACLTCQGCTHWEVAGNSSDATISCSEGAAGKWPLHVEIQRTVAETVSSSETTTTTKENKSMTMFDKLFDFNGNFGKAPEGMFRISVKGAIAVKTSAGYRAYSMDKGRLVNCTMFNLDIGDGMFYVLPTNSVKPGDIILVNRQPRCVLEVNDKTISVVNYEAGTVEQLLPERHMFMGNMYFYGKVVSPLLGLFGKSEGIKGILQMKLMAEMFGGKPAAGEDNPMQMMLMCSLMGKGDLLGTTLDGVFGCLDEEPPTPAPRRRSRGKSQLPAKVDVVDEKEDDSEQE